MTVAAWNSATVISHRGCLFARPYEAGATPRRADPYDEAFWDLHDLGDWEGFARAVVEHVHPRSVVDVGCGHGLALQGFARVDPAIRLHGLDDSTAALGRARKRGLSVSTGSTSWRCRPRMRPVLLEI